MWLKRRTLLSLLYTALMVDPDKYQRRSDRRVVIIYTHEYLTLFLQQQNLEKKTFFSRSKMEAIVPSTLGSTVVYYAMQNAII